MMEKSIIELHELLVNKKITSEELIKESRKSYREGETDLTTLITMEESYRMIMIAQQSLDIVKKIMMCLSVLLMKLRFSLLLSNLLRP